MMTGGGGFAEDDVKKYIIINFHKRAISELKRIRDRLYLVCKIPLLARDYRVSCIQVHILRNQKSAFFYPLPFCNLLICNRKWFIDIASL